MPRIRLGLLFLCAIFAVASLGFASEDDDGEESAVRTLTDANFEHLTQASTGATTGDWFIKFYTNWCGHCKRLKPAWESVAKAYRGKLNVAEVDCQHAGQNTCMRFGVRSYPTIRFLRQGKVYEYNGKDRSEAELMRYLEGAWEEATSSPVPPPFSILNVYKDGFKELYEKSVSSFKVIAREHPEFLVINSLAMFVVGLFTMGIIACFCNTRAFDDKPRKLVQLPRHALKTSDTEDEDEDDNPHKPINDKKAD